jgi:hypothetical protein
MAQCPPPLIKEASPVHPKAIFLEFLFSPGFLSLLLAVLGESHFALIYPVEAHAQNSGSPDTAIP